MENNPAEKVVSDLQRDFKIVGTHRVHSWYAWAIVGIVFGMALGIMYVANRSAGFTSSSAATSNSHQWVIPEGKDGFLVRFLKNLFR